jgi:hypothetical protein
MTPLNPWAERHILSTDPDHIPDLESWMELRLTYAGPLLASTKGDPRARHKHEIRQHLHKQLKRFWKLHPYLQGAREQGQNGEFLPAGHPSKSMAEYRADQFGRAGYRFVPLATEYLDIHCSLSILFLRPDVPGGAIQSADIDNRLKTLFDALRMPNDKGELGGHDTPGDDEDPFFVLLEDDRLISNVSVETDMLLEGVDGRYDKNQARLVITAYLRPYSVSWKNINFI